MPINAHDLDHLIVVESIPSPPSSDLVFFPTITSLIDPLGPELFQLNPGGSTLSYAYVPRLPMEVYS